MKKISASLLIFILALIVVRLTYEKFLKPTNTGTVPLLNSTAQEHANPPSPQSVGDRGSVWESDSPLDVPAKKQTIPTFTPSPAPLSQTNQQSPVPNPLQKIGEESQEDWPTKKVPLPETKRENNVKVGSSNTSNLPNPADPSNHSGSSNPSGPSKKMIPPPNAEVLLPMEEHNRATTIDPREAEKLMGLCPKDTEWEKLSPEKKLEQEHEPTNISVQRTFIAVLPNGEKQTIRVKVPVVYKSRMLRITPDDKKQMIDLLSKAKALEKKLQEAGKESEDILKQWNTIWAKSIPSNALLPESPSLPENQSAGELNRPNTNPDLTPGKGASFQIK